MTDSIYLIRGESELVEMKEAPYDSEALLQTLIAKYPNVLAGDQMDPANPRRWLLVAREMAVPDEEQGGGRWSLDHLFLDQDAIPTLVEVKRASDTRIRREVVGQMMDYAANAVVYWPVEQIRAKYEARCEKDGENAIEKIATLVGCDPEDDEAVEGFWQDVKTNLQAGKIRMVFVADQIPKELRRIVEFLNGQTDPAEVLAVELKQFTDGESRTLVPRVMGQTAVAQAKKSSGRSNNVREQITRDEFFALAAESSDEARAFAEMLVGWLGRRKLSHAFGSGKRQSSLIMDIRTADGMVYPFSFKHTGGLVFQTSQHLTRFKPFDTDAVQAELGSKLNKVPAFDIRGGITGGRPLVRTQNLKKPSDREVVIQILDWIVDQIEEHNEISA